MSWYHHHQCIPHTLKFVYLVLTMRTCVYFFVVILFKTAHPLVPKSRFKRRPCSSEIIWFTLLCKILKQLWFQKAFLLGNININTLVVLFSFFIYNYTCCVYTNKIYISNPFISTSIISALLQYFSWNTAKTLKKLKVNTLLPSFQGFFFT